jgi:hypothetical protein
MMSAVRSAVASVVELLVQGDYDLIEAVTLGRRLSGRELEGAVASWGRTLVSPPPEVYEDVDVVLIVDSDPPTYDVVFDLWTVEEGGRGDLTLEMWVIERADRTVDVEILDLHVL